MNILLIILGIIAILIGIIVIAASMTSSNFQIVAQMPIKRSRTDLYNYVKFLRNSENFNKWVMMDPGMQKTFTGTDATVGFTYAWKSENNQLGEGAQEIIGMEENNYVSYEIRFIKPFANTSQSTVLFTDLEPGVTMVSWTFAGQRKLMMKIFHMLFRLEKALQKDLMESLGNLKKLMEQ
jgi:uncharacterized membrane protein YbaN (DUF454 family)